MRKKVSFFWIVFVLFIISFNGCLDEIFTNESNIIYVDASVGGDFTSIQDAINASTKNHTIFVFSGIYKENIIINKTVNIVGENVNTTIIDGKGSSDVIYISIDGKANISGFTIMNSGESGSPNNDAGIDICSDYNNITGNNITNNKNGIYSTYSQYNNFSHNTITSNSDYNIYLYSGSNHNMIFNNILSKSSCSLRIKGSKYNKINKNLFTDNQKGMYFCCGAKYNIVFNNEFIKNSEFHADDYVGGNQWSYNNIGNYWDDYNGNDIDGDGLGDTSYTNFRNGQDDFPLIKNE
jgi:parallel beta-helix repeat protein